MPLMAKLPSSMGDDPSVVQVQVEEQNGKSELSSQKKERDEKDSGYEDFDAFDEEPEDSDMEGSILNRPRPKKPAKPPAVPARSDKRASKILENVMLELKNLDGSVSTKEAEQQSIISSDPHELYLSSEEDVSLSDDYEDADSLVDFEASPTSDADGEESKPSSRASSRRSQEDTARVVSFTLVTKPQIIQINIPPTAAQKRHSMNLESFTQSTSYIPLAPRRPTPLKLYPSTRRMSIASVNSSNCTPLTHHSNQSLNSLSPRKSSKLSNLSNIMTNAKNSFLASDPFASPARNGEDGDEEQETPITPKTPTSIAAAAWKKSISRTMSKARKPSMPKISLAYTAGVVNRDSRLAMQLAAEESREAEKEKETEKKGRGSEERAQVQRSQTMPTQEGPVRYEDILRNAIRAPPPQSEGKDKEKDRKMSMTSKMGMGFGLNRRRSIKGRGDRYTG